ncbi:MAG TPA: SAM-dependent chlorinase/fluorinase [Tepidisphaeraceae bacterium]|nr:SAM-dependent chlorinase/fluorinase [Tepidisphaeraceae bacterium]
MSLRRRPRTPARSKAIPSAGAAPTTAAAPWRRPIVTLTSDFGLSDSYVAQMKAVIVRDCPEARLIDVTHQVPRHDILCASITLERAVDGFPPGTIHLAVVDPGVGTERRLMVATIKDQFVICPDNGLITWAWRLHGGGAVHEITWRPASSSTTFHGRDVMAPIAARVARGDSLGAFSRAIADPVLLDLAPADASEERGRVIHIDHFGNATTNIRQNALRDLSPAISVMVNRRTIGKLRRTYWDVAPGKPLALIGSSGLLEIAVRDGSARDDLKIRVGDVVAIS